MAAAFAFSPTFDGDNGNPKKRLKLLEADEALVAALEAGEKVRFVGNSSTPDVVLCTARETFKVTKVESSNTTILCAGGAGGGAPVVARGLADFHWEARKAAPRLDLAALLPAYGGDGAEDAAPTRADLESTAQASAAELDGALASGAVLVDGSGRHFHLGERLHKCLDEVLTAVSLQGWPAADVPAKACAADAATHGADGAVAAHCLRHFSTPAATPGHVALDVRKIARSVAASLFVATPSYAAAADLLRRRREDTTLQIRKNKREEGLAKRRAFQRDVAPCSRPKPRATRRAERPTVADMPRLLNEIQSQDPAVVVAATRGWRKLLSVEPQPPVDAVLATGVVAVLARLLAHHAMPELQFEAAWALTNVASTDKTQAVVDAGVVPAMVQLMQSPNGDVREQCIWCLGNIAGDSTESRDAVLAAGRNPATTSLLRNATWSLSNLCRGTPKPDVARLAPAIPVLVGLLRSDDVDTLMDACWALSYLSDGDEARIQCVVDHGAAAALSPLLGHASHKVVTPALRTLGNVVTGNDAQTQAALDAGVLAHVAALLASPRKAIRKETCWLVSNVAAGTPPQIAAVASDAALLKLVVHQLDAGDWDVKKEATWVVSNVLSGGHKNHVLALVEHGVIKPLCALLATAEAKIVTVALDALEAILKAVGIIETYFGAEDDEAPDVAPDIAGDGAAFSFGIAA
ncbi:hypothetical protein JL722_4130 [Aureococcus anophagefferens]|nr:hypothetical protein JL722_4130 [Aureococcus anophagefferens]